MANNQNHLGNFCISQLYEQQMSPSPIKPIHTSFSLSAICEQAELSFIDQQSSIQPFQLEPTGKQCLKQKNEFERKTLIKSVRPAIQQDRDEFESNNYQAQPLTNQKNQIVETIYANILDNDRVQKYDKSSLNKIMYQQSQNKMTQDSFAQNTQTTQINIDAGRVQSCHTYGSTQSNSNGCQFSNYFFDSIHSQSEEEGHGSSSIQNYNSFGMKPIIPNNSNVGAHYNNVIHENLKQPKHQQQHTEVRIDKNSNKVSEPNTVRTEVTPDKSLQNSRKSSIKDTGRSTRSNTEVFKQPSYSNENFEAIKFSVINSLLSSANKENISTRRIIYEERQHQHQKNQHQKLFKTPVIQHYENQNQKMKKSAQRLSKRKSPLKSIENLNRPPLHPVPNHSSQQNSIFSAATLKQKNPYENHIPTYMLKKKRNMMHQTSNQDFPSQIETNNANNRYSNYNNIINNNNNNYNINRPDDFSFDREISIERKNNSRLQVAPRSHGSDGQQSFFVENSFAINNQTISNKKFIGKENDATQRKSNIQSPNFMALVKNNQTPIQIRDNKGQDGKEIGSQVKCLEQCRATPESLKKSVELRQREMQRTNFEDNNFDKPSITWKGHGNALSINREIKSQLPSIISRTKKSSAVSCSLQQLPNKSNFTDKYQVFGNIGNNLMDKLFNQKSSINTEASVLNELDVIERNRVWMQKKMEKQNKFREYLMEKQVENVSFQPKINQRQRSDSAKTIRSGSVIRRDSIKTASISESIPTQNSIKSRGVGQEEQQSYMDIHRYQRSYSHNLNKPIAF